MTEPGRLPALPEIVRARVVGIAATALEGLAPDTVPPSVRPLLRFTRRRRARLAGTPIAAALVDDAFRERIAAQVRPGYADLLTSVEQATPTAVDPVDVAAVAFLVRPSGWQQALAAAVDRVDRDAASSAVDEADNDRLSHQLEESRAETVDVRARLREQIASVKSQNTDLRRKLAAERARAEEAIRLAEAATTALESSREESRAALADARAETRRLRSRVEGVEERARSERTSGREDRESEAVRARLLLDTLLAAAQGLRRELALPPVDVLPADAVATAVQAQGSEAPVRARADTDPALLEQLVALPRAHLLVDGYNVTKSGWAEMPLDAQRSRLVRELAPMAARSGAEITVVFDGADLAARPVVAAPRGVRVIFSPADISADDVLRDLTRAEPAGRPVVVVSSDKEIREAVVAAGARSLPSAALLALLARS
ncbi:MAG: NYN domain-containing protein [Actinomycetota bacterium]|nr:NYN domain-containing protein [Actinomycetota bacterium]